MNNTTAPAAKWNSLVADLVSADEAIADFSWGTLSPKDCQALEAWREEARDRLRVAFDAAEWGPNGATFIRVNSGWPHMDGTFKSLYVNHRLRAMYRGGYVYTYSDEESEEMYQGKKNEIRLTNKAYEEERKLLIRNLQSKGHAKLESFGSWTYTPGQKGGTFHREGHVRVGAYGALRGAWGDRWWEIPAEDAHEKEWDGRLYGARW